VTVAKLVSLIVGVTALASAVVAPWPTVRNGWAWLTGDPNTYAYVHGYEQWTQKMLWLGLFLVLAAVVGAVDRWLGAAVALVGLHASLYYLPSGVPAVMFALLAFCVVCVARAPEAHGLIVRLLIVLLLMESLYVIGQGLGMDVLRGNAHLELFSTSPIGISGNRTKAAILIALTAALLPLRTHSAPFTWRGFFTITPPLAALGLACVALLLLRSLGACIALAAALAWRGRRSWIGLAPVVAGVFAVMTLAATRSYETVSLRAHAYTLIAKAWWTEAFWLGHGLNSYPERLPARGINEVFAGGIWTPAHSDPLQWVYECGVPGLVIVTGFLAAHRRALVTNRYAPAALALLIVACVDFPFHAVTPSVVGACVLGMAISPGATT